MTPALEHDPALAEYAFDLDGGRLCLDFANTLSRHTGEHLNDYVDLVAFARQSGLLTQVDARWLRTEAAARPAEAAAVLHRARLLRDALSRIFSAVARDDRPAEAALEVLNRELGIALSHVCVVPTPPGFAWGWVGGPVALTQPLWPVARSAADLLTSDEVRAVRECGARDCAWLFLDMSKNRSRQWCSMQTCGNREKARRHYARLRARPAGGAGRLSA